MFKYPTAMNCSILIFARAFPCGSGFSLQSFCSFLTKRIFTAILNANLYLLLNIKHQMLGYDFVQQQLSNEYASIRARGFILSAVRRNCPIPNEYIFQSNILALFNQYFFEKQFRSQGYAKIFANHLDKKWLRLFSLKHKSIWYGTKS